MWMSEPMPVMTRIITAASGSSRNARLIEKSPDVIQVKTCLVDLARVFVEAEQLPHRDDRDGKRGEQREAREAAGDGLREPAPERRR